MFLPPLILSIVLSRSLLRWFTPDSCTELNSELNSELSWELNSELNPELNWELDWELDWTTITTAFFFVFSGFHWFHPRPFSTAGHAAPWATQGLPIRGTAVAPKAAPEFWGLSENREHPYTQWFCWSLSIIIPFLNGYFIGKINPTFSDEPIWSLRIVHDGSCPSAGIKLALAILARCWHGLGLGSEAFPAKLYRYCCKGVDHRWAQTPPVRSETT